MYKQPFKTIIIDDEPPARQRLKDLLSEFSDVFKIIGEATNGSDGIALINETNPDVIFLDIEMPEMTGFEMLQKLNNVPIIIFCTAYDNYSLQAFETHSVDYLLKPVRKERLEQTVEKLKFFKKEQHPEQILKLLNDLTNASGRKKEITSITIKSGKKIIFIKLEEIAYFKAEDKYVSLYTKNGIEHITNQTLTALEEELPAHFLKVHRSTIINTLMVKDVQSYFNSRYSITLNDKEGSKITSSRSFLPQIKDWLGL